MSILIQAIMTTFRHIIYHVSNIGFGMDQHEPVLVNGLGFNLFQIFEFWLIQTVQNNRQTSRRLRVSRGRDMTFTIRMI